jgi:hypothetical protein
MDVNTASVVIIGIIALGMTISSVMQTLKPRPFSPPEPPLTRFDAINRELCRLHGDLSDYSQAPAWYAQEINRLNSALIKENDVPTSESSST